MHSKWTPLVWFMLGFLLVLGPYSNTKNSPSDQIVNSAYLNQPFSSDMLLLTSAGQSTDAYVFHDITNKLHLNNQFMPQAELDSIDTYSTLIVVLGYSEVGMRLNSLTADIEIQRINTLIHQFHDEGKSVIAVYIGGEERRTRQTDTLLSAVCPQSDFIILNGHSMSDSFVDTLTNNGTVSYVHLDALEQVSMAVAFLFQ